MLFVLAEKKSSNIFNIEQILYVFRSLSCGKMNICIQLRMDIADKYRLQSYIWNAIIECVKLKALGFTKVIGFCFPWLLAWLIKHHNGLDIM